MGRQSDNALPLLILFIFMADLLKIRKDTAANWQQNNPVLQAGEPGYETDTNFLKIGDGITAWNELKYFQTMQSNCVFPIKHVRSLDLRD